MGTTLERNGRLAESRQHIENQSVVVGVQKWFAIDSCNDVEYFDTPSDAKQAAVSALDSERSGAMDGWSEEVTNIMWGRIVGKVEETYRRPRTDEDVFVSSECDEVVDYEVRDIDDDVTEFAALTDAIGCVRDRRTTAREQGDTEMEMHLSELIEKLRAMRKASR